VQPSLDMKQSKPIRYYDDGGDGEDMRHLTLIKEERIKKKMEVW